MPGSLRLLFSVLAVAAVSVATGPISPAEAGSGFIQVTTTDDELNVDGDCALREAAVASALDVAVAAATCAAVARRPSRSDHPPSVP
jgi:CSLREA domain-containing protein